MSSPAMPKYFQTTSSATSATPPAPQSSALPPGTNSSHNVHKPATSGPQNVAKLVEPQRKPLLRLELRDLSSDGTRAFLRLHHASSVLEHAVATVLRLLYTDMPTRSIPATRSVTLILRSMAGVAYTTGLDIDEDHKEIHISTDYINGVPDTRKKEEIQGVIVHEMVHCWQHNALGTANGGLIEGIADWVRLKVGFAPPHWKRTADGEWDAGYERTAFFLEWLEKEHGEDIVRRINERLRAGPEGEDEFWKGLCGQSVGALWEEYKMSLETNANHGVARDDNGTSTATGSTEGTVATTRPSQDMPVSEPLIGKDPTPLTEWTTATASAHTDGGQDTQSAREYARRGGNMHVPVRPGAAS